MKNKALLAWDLWCILSVVGIWPRFIEPNLITTTRLKLALPNLPTELRGLKIVHFSDLHLHPNVPDPFLKRLAKKIQSESPDMIVFTGDFICYSKLNDSKRLQSFLNSLSAPFGCFAVFGNHDYAQWVSINQKGDYDLLTDSPSSLSVGLQRLVSHIALTKKIAPAVRAIGEHRELIALLKQTPFKILHNETEILSIRGAKLNLCGLGEYILGRCSPKEAFAHYDGEAPGVILVHNPDSFPLLQGYPGDVILSGHTHGGQINLPWLWKKFTLMENMKYKSGLFQEGQKWLYVSRGIGSIMPFRWFAAPEIVVLTLDQP